MISYALKAGKKLFKSVIGPWQHARHGAYARRGNRADQSTVHAAPKAGSRDYLDEGFLSKDLNGRDAPVRARKPVEDLSDELEVTGFLDRFDADPALATYEKAPEKEAT